MNVDRDQMLERPLPNDAEAERATLGAILLDNALIAEAVERLLPGHFYVPSHRKIYLAMCALFEKGSEINQVLIRAELEKQGEVESVGGLSFITSLVVGLPHFVNIQNFADRLTETAKLRQLIRAASQITSEALDAEDEADVLLDRAESAIFSIRDAGAKDCLSKISQLADERIEAAQARRESGKSITGLTTGYIDLDHITAGLQKTDLIVVAARPSMGKSGLALNIAENAASGGACVGLFSLEMGKGQLTDRLISSMARVDAHRLRLGMLNRDEWARIAGARGALSNYPLFIDDTPGLTVMQLRAKCRRLLSSQKRLDLIIVDYLQLMRVPKAENRLQEVSQISRELKGLAKEFDVPLLALAQLSRATEQRADKRPQLSDLRESGTIENDADVVAFIYREEMYSRTEENAGIAEIIVGKQRNGATGTIKLSFIREFTRFENMWRDEWQGHQSYVQAEPKTFLH
ncbi:MAG: replicative helicase [Acidobacteriota bacterium]|nr:replicative helicase [Acidobacteriota bacterium]